MLSAIEDFYYAKSEPNRSCLLSLRSIIHSVHPEVEESWSYSMPFFKLNGRRFCYLWLHKTHDCPYIGIVDGDKCDHPLLLQEDRKRMKILLVRPEEEIPVDLIITILNTLI